jgi:hypothetical protein
LRNWDESGAGSVGSDGHVDKGAPFIVLIIVPGHPQGSFSDLSNGFLSFSAFILLTASSEKSTASRSTI